MSARVTVNTQAVASPPPGVVVDTAQAFIVGQTQRGPVNVATEVFGLADFRRVFGERSGGADVYDAVTSAFKEGLGSAYILRVAGPTPVKATVSLDSAKIVVTAREYGAFANTTWTAAYTNSTKTVTIVKDDVTVTYTGSNAAGVEAACAVDPDVTVTVSSLPSGDIAAAALTGGTDDYASAVPATILALLDPDLGTGAVAWPGKDVATIGEALNDHCVATNRLGLTTMANSDDTQAEAIAAAEAVTDGENLVLLWPYLTVSTNSGVLTMEPVGAALGCRGRAHVEGPQQSPIRDIHGRLRWITGVVEDTTATEWQALNAANVSVIRTSNSQLRLFGWRTIDAPDGVANLQGAQFRDVIDAVAVGCQQIADRFWGRTVDGKGRVLGEFAGAITGFLVQMGAAFFEKPGVDPGYSVDVGPSVNTTEDLAAGNLSAAVGMRLAPTVEFTTITVSATDAAGAI